MWEDLTQDERNVVTAALHCLRKEDHEFLKDMIVSNATTLRGALIYDRYASAEYRRE